MWRYISQNHPLRHKTSHMYGTLSALRHLWTAYDDIALRNRYRPNYSVGHDWVKDLPLLHFPAVHIAFSFYVLFIKFYCTGAKQME